MKKLHLILIALSVLFLFSCDSQSVRDGRSIYKKYLKETLKDPESLKIYKEEVIKDEHVTATFKVDYGAKNSYGGYVRTTSVFETVGNRCITVDGKLIFTEDGNVFH